MRAPCPVGLRPTSGLAPSLDRCYSLVDIYVTKSVGNFGRALGAQRGALAFLYATLCFFGGVPLAWGLELLTEGVLRCSGHGKSGYDRSASSSNGVEAPAPPPPQQQQQLQQEATECARMRATLRAGVLVALAIGLHNAPEGLVTFISYLDSTSSGVTTSIAIAIHNVPEVGRAASRWACVLRLGGVEERGAPR